MHIFLVEKGEGDNLGIVFHLQGFFSSRESKMRYGFKTIFVLPCKDLFKVIREEVLIKICSF